MASMAPEVMTMSSAEIDKANSRQRRPMSLRSSALPGVRSLMLLQVGM